MPARRTRRRFLAAIAASGLAGCAGGPPRDGTSSSTATTIRSGDAPTTGSTDGGTTAGRPDGATTTRPSYDPSVEHDATAWAGYDPDWAAPTDSPLGADLEAEVLVENLEIPWDLSFAPTGELFVSERTGRVLRFESGEVTTVTEPDEVIDAGAVEPGSDERTWFVQGGEGGLLGVAVHPTYPDPPLVYAYYTRETGDGRANRVSYFDVSADDPGATERVVVDGIPAGTIHNGGRIEFGPANYLWVTTGEGGTGANAQDPASLGGKTLRVEPDGSAPADNPDLGPDADGRVYTLGHRNPQGVSWLPDATTVATEHGPAGGDELNRIEAGANYGWPEVRRQGEYAGTDYHPPILNTGRGTGWAPSGSLFYTGDAVPAWRNRLVVGTLIGQHVNVVTLTPPDGDLPPLDGGRRFDGDWLDGAYTATSHRAFADVLGRVRHVEGGPDGGLYAITSNRDGRAQGAFPRERDDVLVRITPAA